MSAYSGTEMLTMVKLLLVHSQIQIKAHSSKAQFHLVNSDLSRIASNLLSSQSFYLRVCILCVFIICKGSFCGAQNIEFNDFQSTDASFMSKAS